MLTRGRGGERKKFLQLSSALSAALAWYTSESKGEADGVNVELTTLRANQGFFLMVVDLLDLAPVRFFTMPLTTAHVILPVP